MRRGHRSDEMAGIAREPPAVAQAGVRSMDVYLVPVGGDKYELYCEVPDDVDAAPGQMPQGLGTHSPEAHHDGVRVECSAHGRLPLELGAMFSEGRVPRSGGFSACGGCHSARRAGSVGPT